MARTRIEVLAPGEWWTAYADPRGPRREPRFLGETPGALVPPASGGVRWCLPAESDVSHVLGLVAGTEIAARIREIVVESVLSAESFASLSTFSPTVEEIELSGCTAEPASRHDTPLLTSARLRWLAFHDTDPRVVGRVPHFLDSVLLHDVDGFRAEQVAHVARACPRMLLLRSKVSEDALIEALAPRATRYVEIWQRFEGPELLAAAARARARSGPPLVLAVRGVSGDLAELTGSLADLGVTLEIEGGPFSDRSIRWPGSAR